jgi:hypothetical protein
LIADFDFLTVGCEVSHELAVEFDGSWLFCKEKLRFSQQSKAACAALWFPDDRRIFCGNL